MLRDHVKDGISFFTCVNKQCITYKNSVAVSEDGQEEKKQINQE